MTKEARQPPEHRGSNEAATGVTSAPAPGIAAEATGIYRLLVESVLDYAIFALDPTGVIRTWNAGAERFKGYTANEAIGKHFSIFYPPDEIAKRKPQRELEIAESEGRVEDEGWRIRKDGTRFWANVVITALRSPSGELVGFAKVTRDLTDRRGAEEVLRQSEERFRLIIESVKDYGMFMLDPHGRIVSWNAGAERIKGYAAHEIIGRHFSAFYPQKDVAARKPDMELKVAAAEGRFEDEGWRVKKDGSLFWANVIITALRDKSGTLVGFAKITRDLTERKASEERALGDARRIADVEAANRTKSEFLTAMSHELRTPLNAIGGYAELIEMGVSGAVNEQQLEYLSRIRGSQRHLLALINDLLNYGRIEANQVTYEIQPVNLLSAVDAVLTMIAPQAQQKNIAVSHGPFPSDLAASADRLKVEQIVLNLVSNAVKFTPRGGAVTTTARAANGHAYIIVQDTGPGIPREKVEAIFEPFVQLGRSLKNAQEGVGLGLAISRDLARAMGGDVTVESSPGRGSVFTLTLPKA